MNGTTRFDERVVALRRDYPLKFRLLELIVAAMLSEAQERQTDRPFLSSCVHAFSDSRTPMIREAQEHQQR